MVVYRRFIAQYRLRSVGFTTSCKKYLFSVSESWKVKRGASETQPSASLSAARLPSNWKANNCVTYQVLCITGVSWIERYFLHLHSVSFVRLMQKLPNSSLISSASGISWRLDKIKGPIESHRFIKWNFYTFFTSDWLSFGAKIIVFVTSLVNVY